MAIRHTGMKTGRRGATLVETAIVLGAFLLFLLGVFEFGRLLMVRHLVDHAAREGARLAVVSSGKLSTTQIKDAVHAHLANQVSNPQIEVFKIDPVTGANLGAWTEAAYGESVAVRITVEYRWMLPVYWSSRGLSNKTPMSATSVMRSEAN